MNTTDTMTESKLSTGLAEKCKQWANRSTPYLFLAPAMLIMGFALIYPIAYMMLGSLYDWRPSQAFEEARFVGLDNYAMLLSDPGFFESLGVTLVFAFSVVSIELLLGIGLALMLERPIRGMSVFRTIFILPMMIAPIVVGLIWRYMYNPQFGVLTKISEWLGVGPIPWLSDPSWSLISVIIADVWQWTPFIFILCLASLQSLPKSTMEAARLDGANTWQMIIHIKLPLMMPVLVVAGLLRLIDAFKVLEVIMVLTNGGPGLSTEILSLRIFKTVTINQELGAAAALSNMLLLVVLLLTVAMFVFNKVMEAREKRARASAEQY